MVVLTQRTTTCIANRRPGGVIGILDARIRATRVLRITTVGGCGGTWWFMVMCDCDGANVVVVVVKVGLLVRVKVFFRCSGGVVRVFGSVGVVGVVGLGCVVVVVGLGVWYCWCGWGV